MSPEHERLRKIAEAAAAETTNPWYEPHEVHAAGSDPEDAAFIAAASPTRVLALLAGRDALAEALEVAKGALNDISFLDSDAETRDIADDALARLDTIVPQKEKP